MEVITINEQPLCRVCFNPNVDPLDPLIAPCKCSGNIKWIHRDCLDEWRETQTNKSFTHCEICKFKYEMVESSVVQSSYWCLFKYYALFIRDIAVLLAIVETTIGLLVLLLYNVDSKNHTLPNLFPNWEIRNTYIFFGHVFDLGIICLCGLIGACIDGFSKPSRRNFFLCYCPGFHGQPGGQLLGLVLIGMLIVVSIFGWLIGIVFACKCFYNRFLKPRKIVWEKQHLKRWIVHDLSESAILIHVN